MYPLNHFALFPSFPHTNKVFVITAFDERFDNRFTNVIAPAIARAEFNGAKLAAYRVNESKIGDSILIEILQEIQTARLVIADVSALDQLNGRPIRNPNALYELGIAHAVRLPEEVLIFRSDDLALSFDIANVRVRRFDPDNKPKEAQEILGQAVVDALQSLELTRHLAVQKAARSLDIHSWLLLAKAYDEGPIVMQRRYTMAQMGESIKEHLSIGRLLDAGLLAVEYVQITAGVLHSSETQADEQLHKFAITPFGRVVVEFTVRGRFAPDARALLDQRRNASSVGGAPAAPSPPIPDSGKTKSSSP